MPRRAACLLLLLCGCAAAPAPLPEPPSASKLCFAVDCEAHMIEPYRTISARAFRGTVVTAGSVGQYHVFGGGSIALRKRGESRIYRTEVDAQGRFEIRTPGPGTYEFVVWHQGMDPDMGWIVISPWARDREVRLYLRYGV